MVDAKTFLKTLDMFPMLLRLAPHASEELRNSASSLLIEEGSVLFSPGDYCRSYPLVLEGRVRVFQEDGDGRQITLYDIHAGELCVLSTTALLGQNAYSAFACAREDCRVVMIPEKLFMLLTESSAEWRSKVFRLVAERLVELTALVDAIAFRELDQRLARLLTADASSTVQVTHQQLADEMGSVRVIVTRLLGVFEDRGWVRLDRGKIQILNREALVQFAAKTSSAV